MLTEVGRGRCSGSVTVWRWLLGRIGLLGLLGLCSLPHAGMLWALLTGTKEPHEGATEVQFPQIPRAFLVTPICALAMGSIREKFCLVSVGAPERFPAGHGLCWFTLAPALDATSMTSFGS